VGAGRAAARQGPGPALHAGLATPEDEQRLLDWANDPPTRANAFSPAQIPLVDHQRWLRARLADPQCRLYVVEARGEGAIGTVRLQRETQGWEVHFNLAAHARGRGLGRGLVSAGLQALSAEAGGTALVFGRVKAGNQASCRVFEGLGFVRQATPVGEPLEFRSAG